MPKAGYRLLLRSEFMVYACFGSLQLGLNVLKLLKAMIAFMGLCWLIAQILTMNTHMVLGPTDIQYRSLFSLEKKIYSYSDIESIVQLTKIINAFKQEPLIQIEFKDGHHWKSSETEELSAEKAEAIADYLEQKTGLSVTRQTQ